jgi:hypothetical protein
VRVVTVTSVANRIPAARENTMDGP